MDSQKEQSEVEIPASVTSPCWKKKAAEAGFLANFKDHVDEFVNTSMDKHKICLKNTFREVGDYVSIKKMFRSSKVVSESDSGSKEVASSPPVQTVTSQ